jgi:hypothetical protein
MTRSEGLAALSSHIQVLEVTKSIVGDCLKGSGHFCSFETFKSIGKRKIREGVNGY